MRGVMKPGKEFFEALRNAGSRLLILDYDGTLSPFVSERSEARPYPGVLAGLAAVGSDEKTRIVVISGRSLAELERLTEGFPRMELWGSYGLERRREDGRVEIGTLSEAALLRLKKAAEALLEFKLGYRLEVKPFSLAIHHRGCDPETLRIPVMMLGGFVNRKDLVLRSFDGGVELMTPEADKGRAVERMIKESDDPAGLFPVALGDDYADEEVFKVIREAHGYGVLVRPRYRVTGAQYWLKPPEELLEFFNEWVGALTRD